MRENRTYGSEGGEARAFPTPISSSLTFTAVFPTPWHSLGEVCRLQVYQDTQIEAGKSAH
jgi:hypothetical protein